MTEELDLPDELRLACLREAAIAIVEENAKWARQRGLDFTAKRRAAFAKKLRAGCAITVELKRAAEARVRGGKPEQDRRAAARAAAYSARNQALRSRSCPGGAPFVGPAPFVEPDVRIVRRASAGGSR